MFFIYLIFIFVALPSLDADGGPVRMEMNRARRFGQEEELEQQLPHPPQHQEHPVATGTLINDRLFEIAQEVENAAPVQSPVENEGNRVQIDLDHLNRRFQGHNHHRIRNHRNNNQRPCCTIL